MPPGFPHPIWFIIKIGAKEYVTPLMTPYNFSFIKYLVKNIIPKAELNEISTKKDSWDNAELFDI